MKQEFYNLHIKTNGQKLYEFTNDAIHWIGQNNFKNGILNLSIQHTSASLIVIKDFFLSFVIILKNLLILKLVSLLSGKKYLFF